MNMNGNFRSDISWKKVSKLIQNYLNKVNSNMLVFMDKDYVFKIF